MVGDDFFIDRSIKDSTDMTLDIEEECPPSTILRRVLQFYGSIQPQILINF